MLGTIEGSLEWSPPGIYEWDSEGLKKQKLLEMKYNIKEGDKLWATVAFTKSVSNGIKVDIFNWNSEGIILGISDDETLVLYYSTILGVYNYFKLLE